VWSAQSSELQRRQTALLRPATNSPDLRAITSVWWTRGERKVEQPETRAPSSPARRTASWTRKTLAVADRAVHRGSNEKTRTTAHAKAALSSNIPDPHYPPSYPLAVLNSSPPPSSSSSTSTHLGLSQPSRLLFILRFQLCIVRRRAVNLPHWLPARIITYRQARKTSLTPASPTPSEAIRNTATPGTRRNR
jgi:hypothetical protein